MDERAIEEMFAAEECHFWFRGTRRIVMHILEQRLGAPAGGLRVLDIGCGTGLTMQSGRHLGGWLGLDQSARALQLAQRRVPEAHFLRGDARLLPFNDCSFDAVLALDLLEHLDDDLTAAIEIHRVLRPEGMGLIAVPGWPVLFGPHDRALAHRRRYSRRSLVQLLSSAGLTIELLSSYNLLMAPFIIASRLFAHWRREVRTDVGKAPAWVNRPLEWLLSLERYLVGRVAVRGGITLMAVVRPK